MTSSRRKIDGIPSGAKRSFRLVDDSEVWRATHSKPVFKKEKIEIPDLLKRLEGLTCTGKIKLVNPKNDFWAIELGEDWQKFIRQGGDAVEHIARACKDDDNIKLSAEWALKWSKLMGIQQPKIGFFSPTSILAHVSLGNNAPAKHACVVEGKVVKFRVTQLTTMPFTQSLPMNYPGNHRIVDGKRDYASQWYFANVEFIDFPYPFFYPPHITIACHGLMGCPEAAVKALQDAKKRVLPDTAAYTYGSN